MSSSPLELELQMVKSFHVGGRNQNLVLSEDPVLFTFQPQVICLITQLVNVCAVNFLIYRHTTRVAVVSVQIH